MCGYNLEACTDEREVHVTSRLACLHARLWLAAILTKHCSCILAMAKAGYVMGCLSAVHIRSFGMSRKSCVYAAEPQGHEAAFPANGGHVVADHPWLDFATGRCSQ